MFENDKKKIKFIAEFLIFVACIFMIYSLALKSEEQAENTPALAHAAVSHIAASGHSSPYHAAQAIQNPAQLQSLAKGQAHQMLRSGDVTEYENQLKAHGL